MPLYEYQCDACGQRFEIIQKFSDPAPDACRKCGKGPAHRLQSSPAIQFKGSGWYITDYAQKSKGDAGAREDAGSSGSPAKTDASSGSSKGESAPKADAPAAAPAAAPATSTTKD